MPALTPWFPPSVKPVHRGVYPTKLIGIAGFSFWDGSCWGSQGSTRAAALRLFRMYGPAYASQSKSWRGLAQKP